MHRCALPFLLLVLAAAIAFPQDEGPKKEPPQPVLPSDLLLREDQPWSKADVAAPALQPLLAEAEKWLAEVAKEPVPEGQTPPLKAPLEEMVASFKQLITLLERQGTIAKVPDDLAGQLQKAQRQVDDLLAGPAPTLVEGVLDSKSIEGAVAIVTGLRAEEAAAQEALKKLEDRLAAGPEEQKKATSRLTEARAALTALVPAAELTGAARTAALLRAQDARLAVRVAEKQLEVLGAEVKWAQAVVPLRRAEHELASKRVALHAAALEKLSAELKDELERRRRSLDYQVQAAHAAYADAQKGGEPFAILHAMQELWIAEANLVAHGHEEELNQVRAQLQKERDFLKNEQVAFENLRRIIEKGGRRGQLVAERLYPMFRRVQKDLAARDAEGPEKISRRLAELQLDRAELSAVDPGAELRADFDPAKFGLRPFKLDQLKEEMAAGERERVKRIGERLGLLTNLAQEFTELEGVTLEIDEHLRSKHDYLLQRLFWIQEEAPLAPEVVQQGAAELRALESGLARSLAEAPPQRVLGSWLAGAGSRWATLAGILTAPLLIVYLRRRVRRQLRTPAEAAPDAPPPGKLGALAAGTVSALLWPGYILLLPLLLGLHAPGNGVAEAVSEAAVILAVGLALHTFGKVYFGRHGVFPGRFGLPDDACVGLYRLLRASGLLTGLLLAPALFFRRPEIGAPAAGRVCYTAYEGLLSLLLVWKLRKTSPTVAYLFGAQREDARGGFLFRWWPLGHALGTLAAAGIVGMDVMGYRYGARVISWNVLESIATVLVTVIFYRMLLALAQRLDTVGRLLGGAPRAERKAAPPDPAVRERVEQSYRKFLRLVLGLTGAVVLALTWGLDARILKSFDAVILFAINPEANVFLTLGDLLLAGITTIFTWTLLANLDGVFEVLLFPYLGWDQGVRYAALALSRYALFFTGLMITLGLLHVSLTSLQWIIAAASVGIGFGLQEVIANFICGIILLLERPIRIGDIVTIGNTAGTVRKINIRSTTVENWNYESMIIPNREFIVGKVINWTHEDTVTRLVLNIRVAYGTDLEKAKDILLRAVREHPLVPKEPASGVSLSELGESSVNFVLFLYAAQPEHRGTIQEEVLARVYREFQNAGIGMPYPQQDLHVKALPPELMAWLAARSEERGARSEERGAKGEERGARSEERGAKGEEGEAPAPPIAERVTGARGKKK